MLKILLRILLIFFVVFIQLILMGAGLSYPDISNTVITLICTMVILDRIDSLKKKTHENEPNEDNMTWNSDPIETSTGSASPDDSGIF